jgi:hypothetical protein
MELDLDLLRKDRYFRREFLFEPGPETGKVRTALRLEQGRLVELRQGAPEPRGAVPRFQVPGAALAGWEPEGTPFWPAFRRGLLEPVPLPGETPVPAPLEPVPLPGETPVPAPQPLPEAIQGSVQDRYLVDFTRPDTPGAQGPPGKGELEAWAALLARTPVPHWGFWVGPDGTRRMVFPWPEGQDGAFLEACRATLLRRAARVAVAKVGCATELQVGPGLPALAIRRVGAWLWVGPSAASLREAPAPRADGALVRWSTLDLGAARAEGPRWARVEGPGSPETVRPFSDRVLGLLGWMPSMRFLSVERHRTDQGWEERAVFAPSAP